MTLKEGRWVPQRVLPALGKIGYAPSAAILDIADNSVSAGASRISISLESRSEERSGPGRRRAILARVSVADDACGMDEDQLDRALALGSEDDDYKPGTLSKFGLGLKSAASSLGKRLTIVTRSVGNSALTAVVDQDQVREMGKYVYDLREPTEDELASLDAVAGTGAGTVIAISKIHEESMVAPTEIAAHLKDRAGIAYHHFLAGLVEGAAQLSMDIDGEVVAPVDPLFAEEASANGDLNELDWDGTSVRWIQHPQNIQLSDDGSVTATVSMTQLPHPPSVALAGEIPQAETRRRYRIAAGEYGFYIYRNGRLISWAESLGYVPQNQDMYSFRGKLEISSDADDVLNIDVTKSRLHLSDVADFQLKPLAREGVKKSRNAWQRAGARVTAVANDNPHESLNEELNRVEELEDKADELDEEVAPEEERQRLRKRRQAATESKPATPEETEAVRARAQRVQYVPVLDNNQLWERARDAEAGLIVRVNSGHRFVREIIEGQSDNPELVKAFGLLMFALARGEYSLVYKSYRNEAQDEATMQEFRERTGTELSDIMRQMNLGDIFPGS